MGPATVYSAFVADFDSHMKKTISSTRASPQAGPKAPSRDQHYRPYNRHEFAKHFLIFFINSDSFFLASVIEVTAIEK
jgi:hypothetical protein